MHELYAQGDLLIECLGETPVSGPIIEPVCGVTILAEGEATGHRHAIYDTVLMFRDESLARDVPEGLYVGHVRVESPFARVEHNEHDTINLPRGTYRVTRQRELQPGDAVLVAD
jgi:hypothetical protein